MEKVLVAMSGGVDSAVCALLLKEAGYDAVGVTMRLLSENADAERDAEAVAKKVGIPFSVVDLREAFSSCVVDRFVREYEAGRTPNPCVDCNRSIKFGALMEVADRLGCAFLATGHYARLTREGGIVCLRKAKDESKDQSYMLACLSQETLSRVLLPLGDLTKAEVRALAAAHGFVNAEKKDSQDICFIPDGDHAAFLSSYTGKEYPAGDFVGPDGRVLGKHKGLVRYTVGQRKGLGLSLPSPLFVEHLDPEKNAVFLSDEPSLMKKEITLKFVNFAAHPSHIPFEGDTFPCLARVRYRQKETPASATLLSDSRLRVTFVSPVRAPAPGQTAVLYAGDEVLASGEIE